MGAAMGPIKVFSLLTVLIGVVPSEAREWTDPKTKRTFEAELVECRVVLQLRSGRKKIFDIASLSEADRLFVIEAIENQAAAAKAPVAAAGNLPPVTAKKRPNAKNLLHKHTDFGSVKLDDVEIQRFIADCRAEKKRLLDVFKMHLGRDAEKMSPDDKAEAKSIFNYLSQDNVLIPSRTSGGNTSIFKPAHGRLHQYFGDSETFTTLEVIDKNSAFVMIPNIGERVILEGIDTGNIPANGEWPSRLLLKKAGVRMVPGLVGDYEMEVYQAVSDEGFPKDIIIW
jgi:hypothetical protein